MATIYRTRATLFVAGTGVDCLLTHYWDSTGAAPAAMATEALARVRAQLNALVSWIPGGSAVTFNSLVDEVDEGTGTIVNQQAGTVPAGIAFTGSLNLAPAQTQGLALFNTSTFIGGRRLKGRMFIPGVLTGAVTATGGVASLYATAIAAGNTALGATVVTAINQRVWHRPRPGSAGLSAVVSARSVSPTFAVLRSRRR